MIIQLFCLALLVCFYAAYFIKQIHLKKKGVTANRLAQGAKPKKTKIIEVFLLIATYGIAAVQFVGCFFSKYFFELPLSLPFNIAGLVIMSVGIFFFTSAIIVMKDSWRAGIDENQKTSIVTSGIYKISRNPAFAGFILLYIGTALATPNIVMSALTLVAIILFHLQIIQEEKYLVIAFGDEYLEYKKNTPRYFLFF